MEYLLLALYVTALLVLFLYGMHGLMLVWFYYRSRPQEPVAADIGRENLPTVTLQLPIYNEMHVVRRLMQAVCALDYPHDRLQIQILDDSTDATSELLQRLASEEGAGGLEIDYLHRENRDGFKAGALREGLIGARGEFIAIFDADFVPEPDFLLRAIPHLIADSGLGMVQGRWEHLNGDYSLLTRIQAMMLDAHFTMEQQVRNREGLFINFNGTAGVWRKACILDAGNWQSDTLTEDLDLSYRAQLRGWRFLYLNRLTVPAELPSEINGMKTQQFRWTKGAIESAKKHLAGLWRSRRPLRVKFYATMHLTANMVFPCVLAVALLNIPVVLLKHRRPDLAPLFDVMSIFALASVGSFLFYLTALRDIRVDWRRRMLLFPLFMAGTMGLAVGNSRAVLEALAGHRSEFRRTPKYNIVTREDSWKGSRYHGGRLNTGVFAELLLALYFLVGVALSVYYVELSAIPFQLMFLVGFGLTGGMSLRHAWGGGK